jgi:hypothetical protein
VQDFMRGMGLGMIADQLADLKLGELLNTPPPGLDEAVAVAKVSGGGSLSFCFLDFLSSCDQICPPPCC